MKLKDIIIDDPINIYQIVLENNDAYSLYQHFEYNYRKYAKKYNLENPRKETNISHIVMKYWKKERKQKK